MLPVTLGLGLINVNLLGGRGLRHASSATRPPRAIDAAFRLYLLPQGVFSVAISTVLFPTISRLAAREDIGGPAPHHRRRPAADLLHAAARLGVPAGAGGAGGAAGVPARASSTRPSTAAHLRARSSSSRIGLAFNGASLLVIRAFFSLQLPWLATKVAALGVVLNAALDADLLPAPRHRRHPALDLASRASSPSAVMLWLLERELGGLHGAWVVDGVAAQPRGQPRLGAPRVVRPGRCSTTRSAEPARRSSSAWPPRSRPRTLAYVAAAHAFEMPELRAAVATRAGRYDELPVDQRLIRNFCIIAHIDHGKSTLADRILQRTGARERARHAQPGARLDGPRARAGHHDQGAGRARALHGVATAQTYQLNLIDTPGHVDFSYEVSRSLAACEGALLVVDASQGIEAQTLANTYLAIEGDLEIDPGAQQDRPAGRRPGAARARRGRPDRRGPRPRAAHLRQDRRGRAGGARGDRRARARRPRATPPRRPAP